MLRSGIYKMIFGDGSFYIGKSEDMVVRAKQHIKSMEEGRHSVKVQAAYNKCGLPSFDLAFMCHKDHIDIIEGYFIAKYWGSPGFLNSASGYKLTEAEMVEIENVDPKMWELSTLEHIRLASESECLYLRRLLEQEKKNKVEVPQKRGFWSWLLG